MISDDDMLNVTNKELTERESRQQKRDRSKKMQEESIRPSTSTDHQQPQDWKAGDDVLGWTEPKALLNVTGLKKSKLQLQYDQQPKRKPPPQ